MIRPLNVLFCLALVLPGYSQTVTRLKVASKPADFARFTYGDLANPGAFHWNVPVSLTPSPPHYSGKVIIVVDEVTQGQAEYTTMAFRTAPGAIVIGSTTAGADGNVSTVPLPGGLSSYISGIGVFYPDKTPTQRVGIIPDIVVTPTIAGIQAGRDELIEEALARSDPSEQNDRWTFRAPARRAAVEARGLNSIAGARAFGQAASSGSVQFPMSVSGRCREPARLSCI